MASPGCTFASSVRAGLADRIPPLRPGVRRQGPGQAAPDILDELGGIGGVAVSFGRPYLARIRAAPGIAVMTRRQVMSERAIEPLMIVTCLDGTSRTVLYRFASTPLK
ncbi:MULTISPECIES: hypothetical protein [unclassified Streptomyces]|uniref:hypothetical protein n=1 Tax=unclassified Streptomyces TaxID=2593676 RepID=UPI002258F399|nr:MULTISPECIES: hypothetical protein [unclassified Streptomyces]MCX5291393.1 hypothetical protein [Streptomyces sp. NBC_00183]